MSNALKRGLDILVAGAALLLLSPVILATAAAVRLGMGPPVLFRQERPGRGGEPFTLLKFRTMTEPAARDGTPAPDEARLTPLGRWLRSTSLDELPSLWNVLRGDMSLVGPRPLLMEYLPLYTDEQMRRHEVRPGITGLAQVRGRNALAWEEKFALDVEYVDRRSLWLDFRIIALTFGSVVRREGISQPGRATMERFTGTGTAAGDDADSRSGRA